MYRNTAKIFCRFGYRIYKGKKCDSDSSNFVAKKETIAGESFWARGYAVSTVGFELEAIRKYIREQEDADEYGRF